MRMFSNILIVLSFLHANVELSLNNSTYMVGEHVEVYFSGLDSSESDWIGIFESEFSNDEYIIWQYTNGSQINDYSFVDSGSIVFSPITLPVGEYEIRLFYNNNYELILSYPFSVTDSCIEPPISDFEDTFKAMTFNTWHSAQYGYGGLERVAEIIFDLGVDIIGFQETDSASIVEIQFILENFEGYETLHNFPSSWGIGILSKFPIIEVYDYNLYGMGVDLFVSNIDTIKFISSHLTAYPYGPYDLYEGVSIDEVIDNELSVRYVENLNIYNQIIINPNNNPQLPVIYVGDHNVPSSLDWNSDNINQNFGFEINWPISDFLLDNNFFDSYREVYPSAYHYPGLTWTPGYPKNNFDSWDVHDRIDMIYFRNGESKILYAINSYTFDCDPWPSDHRAVITEFSICSDVILGDINSDDVINILDVILLVDEILNSTSLYCLYKRSDIDFNEELNILDVVQLVNLILN